MGEPRIGFDNSGSYGQAARTVAIFAALDTKGKEAGLIRDFVSAHGPHPLVVDIGVLGDPLIPADVARVEVAAAGGADITELVASRDKARSMEVMFRGAPVIAKRLYDEGRLDGVIGIGGGAGTAISTSAMRALPVGVPKLVVSTVAGDTRHFVGMKDVTMMYSVVDIAGLNRVTTRILTNAAAAIVGMVNAEAPVFAERPLIAASMFGNTTPLVDRARQTLEKAGYEVLVFHATGLGGRTMESLISEGVFCGVFDVTTTEWADELNGGVAGAGPKRLEAAGQAGIPQVIVPGCLDMINFGAPETVPERFRDHRLYQWTPHATLVRTNPEENGELGRVIAEKASLSRGPVTILLPLRGVSQLDIPGGPFWWPEANQALFDAIKAHVREDIQVIELDNNINDPDFADRSASLLLELLTRGRR